MILEIIEGRVFRGCRLVVTLRYEVGIKFRKYCDILLEVEGFIEEDVREFIFKYFKNKENLVEKFLFKLRSDKNLKDMVVNFLNIVFFCFVCEEYGGSFLESRI